METTLMQDFQWLGDLLKKNFPEYLKDFDDIKPYQSGLTEKGLLLQRMKVEAGEIPEETCADIDRVIKGIDSALGLVSQITRKCEKENEAWDYADDAERALDGLEIILEKLRDENQKLRELGKFWYMNFEKLVQSKS